MTEQKVGYWERSIEMVEKSAYDALKAENERSEVNYTRALDVFDEAINAQKAIIDLFMDLKKREMVHMTAGERSNYDALIESALLKFHAALDWCRARQALSGKGE